LSTSEDETHMRRAIALARQRLGLTGSNPAVGCVIARGGTVIAEAATAESGRPHAEEQAVEIAGADAIGATAYVSLEPCGERSSGAASCAERLIATGIARVVYAVDNPDRRSAGQGPARLLGAGVLVEAGLLGDEAADVYAMFLRPYGKGGG
jgi:pyrimidine deaminase RibD-like protein